MGQSVQDLRLKTFRGPWPLDEEIQETASTTASHSFLANPAGQYSYVYLTRFMKAWSEQHFGRPFGELDVLDWGCGKGHVSKMLRDLGPRTIDSCDVLSEKDDSAFGQEAPILKRFGIAVTPLEHEYLLPYADDSYDVLLSMGVLEHVPNDRASLQEIYRVLRPGGLFFCFFLPTNLSWTQKVAHWRGNDYHDRLYDEKLVDELLAGAGLRKLNIWFRQLFPKNTVRYPNFRLFERADQMLAENTPLKYFATNIEFVAEKPKGT